MILPATIDAEEFEAIFACLTRDYDMLKEEIEALVLEQKEADEEKELPEPTGDGRIDSMSTKFPFD